MIRYIIVLLGLAVAVHAQIYINGKWWTNGEYRIVRGNWEWGTSGVTFNDGDSNWSNDPVREPDGDSNRWATERVSYGALTNAWYADNLITELNHAICE
ncbi:hypothetical protein B566_EDAN002694 [Ephemera danica]|nr:hypothetical protein B566_EDAN002694 [Ephemera danica]